MLPAIDTDIRTARALPFEFYSSAAWRERVREDVLARAWHVVPAGHEEPGPGSQRPFTLLPGCLDEPVVLTCDGQGERRALSNVCTHRGHLVALEPRSDAQRLRCRYHGRCFGLDGRFESAPGFDAAPTSDDDLAELERRRCGPLTFVALDADVAFATWIAPARHYLAPFLDAPLVFEPQRSRTYDVDAEWLLYVDNYLEGFHVPFVHPGLSRAIDLDAYQTEPVDDGVLQWATASDDEPALSLPAGHPHEGQRVAAYYLWLFPNLMLNVYPWGLSLNSVEPRGAGRTQVRFETWISDAAQLDIGAGADLHQVELEDEAVVERVQQGISTRLGRRAGRYSPTEEQGVHHFHRLLIDRLARNGRR